MRELESSREYETDYNEAIKQLRKTYWPAIRNCLLVSMLEKKMERYAGVNYRHTILFDIVSKTPTGSCSTSTNQDSESRDPGAGPGKYELVVKEKNGKMSTVASWRVEHMPHCRHICVFIDAQVEESFRGTGLGTILNKVRLELAKASGYSLALCTVREDNPAQNRIMKKNMWRIIETLNEYTEGAKVYLYSKTL
jgi:predicted acetyltransferase